MTAIGAWLDHLVVFFRDQPLSPARFLGVALLRYHYRHQVRPEFTCRFRWRPGSIALWDNRCTQHNAVNDDPGHRRLMHLITLAGDRPRGT